MSQGPVGVAVVGCGTISHQYLDHLTGYPDLTVLGCADLDVERAKDLARHYRLPLAGDVETLLAHPEVELVVNLTVPAAHALVAEQAVAAGKHVYTEKPLVVDRAAGRHLLDAAARAGVRVGAAPDTFLGAGLQTARRLLDSGAIGEPLTALTLLQGPGPEAWHPSPEFLYQEGAGPLFDLGPYYLTLLASLFGPARRVQAVARRSRDTRVVGSGPKAGTTFAVEVPTHVSALVEYAAGPAATMLFSFESPLSRAGFVEITGTEATMAVPDPNTFDGTIRLRAAGDAEWREVPATGAVEGRGLGVLEMARAIRAGVPHRAAAELGLHVLDTMLGVQRAAETGQPVGLDTTTARPAALAEDFDPRARTL